MFFKRSEFDCNCCGQNEMDDHFLQKLEVLRHRLGFPLIVTSGYRCPEHNCRCSSTGPNGPHTTGRAVDFKVARYEAYKLLAAALTQAGDFTGVGVKQHGDSRFIHLDDLPGLPNRPRPTIWGYP